MSEHVRKRQGVRRYSSLGLPFAVVAAALLLAVPTASGAQEATSVAIGGQCVGPTEADNVALATTQLSGYGISADVSMPSRVELGEPATVSIALSFDLSEFLVAGAATLDIDTANFAGSEFPVTLISPSGSEQKVIIPSNPVVDTSVAGRIELGSADFSVPTESPGVIQLQLDPSTLIIETAPADLAATATCAEGGYSDLPVGFIVDPLAPTIDPPLEVVEVDPDTQGTVELASRVTPGPGPIVDESWRIVRTHTAGAAPASASAANGVLTYEATGSPTDVVWEVCGRSSELPESTTTESATAAEPTTHCAQGLLRLRSTPEVDVLSSSEDAGVPTTQPVMSDATRSEDGSGDAPVSVTG